MAEQNAFLTRYREEVVPALMDEFGYENIMRVPGIKKVVVNIGVGEAIDDPKSLDGAVEDLRIITGQQPIVTKARARSKRGRWRARGCSRWWSTA